MTATTPTAPRVTVVIPVYNGVNYLVEAIRSVLAQTYRDFEVLVVDDGSTDGTWAIIEQAMAEYPDTVRGLRKENGGVASALNAGIQAAQGHYIAWLSHDDRWLPNKLEKQFALLQCYPDAVGAYSDYAYIDGEGCNIGRMFAPWYPPDEMMRHLLQLHFINGSTVVVERRCLLEANLFDESLLYSQDVMMWMHLASRHPLVHVPEPLVEYRLHGQQTTNVKLRALQRENRTWIKRLLDTYPIQQFFPELARPDVPDSEVARAYLYLGDVCVHKKVYRAGIRQYVQAWLAWRSRRNPAPRKIFRASRQARIGDDMPATLMQQQEQALRQGRSFVIDCRPWNELIKHHRIYTNWN